MTTGDEIARRRAKLAEERHQLATAQQALLEKRLRRKPAHIANENAIPKRLASGPAPLSFSQQRLWFLDQVDPGNPAYNNAIAVRLMGQINAVALERSLNKIIQRHEVLRTQFAVAQGQPIQIVSAVLTVTVPVIDLREVSKSEQQVRIQQLISEEARSSFDLAHGPLLRATLLRLSEEEHVLLLTIHHIVFDGWSGGILIRELIAFYQAASNDGLASFSELLIQYADYAAWQRQWLQGEVLEKQLAYWRGQLAGLPDLLELPTDHPRPVIQTFQGSRLSFELSRQLSDALKVFAQAEQATLFMLLLAAFDVLLYRYSGQADLVVGSPIANRPWRETEGLIGFFVNTLVLRSSLTPQQTFREVLTQLRDRTFAAYAHQDLPFEKLVEDLQPTRDLSRTPLFQVMFVLQNAPLPALELPGLVLQPLEVDSGVAKFDLTLSFLESPTGLRGTLEYNTDLFERERIARLAGHLQVLLASIVAQPDQRVRDLPLLTEDERQRLLQEWNRPPVVLSPAPQEGLHTRFEAQATQTPDVVAVVWEDEEAEGAPLCLTYGELNRRAQHLADYLRHHGAGPEVLVGLCLERSAEMLVGLLGILKSGSAYVPLDPTYPPARLAFMLHDTQAPLVVTQAHLRERLPAHQAQVVCLDADWAMINQCETESHEVSVYPDQPAYVIYTSGSTGRPKGVVVTHANVLRLFETTQAGYHFEAADVWSLFHSLAFDFSVWEVWGAWLYGGRVVVIPYAVSRSPEEFYHLLQRQRVTVLNQIPSAFRQLMRVEEELNPTGELDLRYVIFGGEALDLASLRSWVARHGDHRPQLINMYGITETTVHVTSRRITATDVHEARGSVIGQCLPDLWLRVLEPDSLQPAPIGVRGEVYVGGAGLARGYLARPELTAERFVPDPWAGQSGARLYKTGDAARYLPNGDLEYLGRLDQQVKVRGFRIELGEIEAALNQHPAVRESLVLVRDEAEGQRRLVAYVIPREAAVPSLTDLHLFLKRTLPDYMLPAALVPLAEWPHTPSGKRDPRALPPPDMTYIDVHENFVPPHTPIEQGLAEIWAQVLGLEQVGVQDNFFALGGDSILSIQVLARAREQGLHFSLKQLLQYQTIQSLVANLAPTSSADLIESVLPFSLISEDDRRKLPPGIEDAYPLTRLQAGMLFHVGYEPENTAYHNVSTFHVRAPFDEKKLRAVLQQLATRHPVLRTSFDLNTFSEPLQLVHPTVEIPWHVIDLRQVSSAEQDAQVNEWFEAEKLNKFDFTQPPLWRICIHRRGAETFQLSLTEHHAIVDGWSVASLLTEMFQIYLAELGAEVPPIPPAPAMMFRGFVAAERKAIASEDVRRYWQTCLAESSLTSLPRWPMVYRETAIRHMRAHEVSLSPELSIGLKRFARSAGVPLKSVLLAAHLRVLSLLSGQSDVVSGVISNGRPEGKDGERVLGLFLNTVPFRLSLSGGTWIDLARATFAAERDLLPFRRYPLADLQKLLGKQPLFEASFNFVHFHVYQGTLGFKEIQILEGKTFQEPNFDLVASFSVDAASSQVQLSLGYNVATLCEEQIKAINHYYITALTAMIDDPSARYETCPLLSHAERLQQLEAWQGAGVAYPRLSVAAWLTAQVERTPERVALVCGDEHLTYRALNQRANHLAHHLQGLGVGPNVLVGLCLERSIEMLVGLWGILKAGGAYVPLDPTYPPERLAAMLTDAQVAILLTQQHLVSHLPEHHGIVLCLDTDWDTLAQESADDPSSRVTPRDLLYVIFTSGSTGRPKGAGVYHHSFVNLLQWFTRDFDLTEDDRTLIISSFSFDLTQKNFYAPLLVGGQLRLLPTDHYDPTQILDAVSDGQVTWLNCTPSAVYPLVENAEAHAFASLASLRYVFLGGEPIALPRLWPWLSAPACQADVVNTYGPTECTDICAGYRLTQPERLLDQVVPLGTPIDNTRVLILNPALELGPVGVVGEVCVAGVGVGLGYLNDRELTALKFVPDPFSLEPGARLYRTGDLARYRPDGTLEFLGRADQQVKVRGYRIELSEIEAALRQHPAVREVVVLARSTDEHLSGEDRRLVAYVVGQDGQTLAAHELHDFLRDQVPDYMLPSAFVWLDALPLTPNGKLDRRALPAPEAARPDLRVTYVAPRTPAEDWLAQIWTRVLRLERVGIHDNFFELGGDSIQGAILINQVQEQLGEVVYVVALFDAPTLAELARYLHEHYPQALARRLALAVEPTSSASRSTITAEQVTHLRHLIPPLSPRRVRPATKNRAAIFVLSPPRSGSTLLRVMLAGHPHLFAPPELELLSFNTLGERQRALSGRNRFWREGTLRALRQLQDCSADEAERFMHDLEERDVTTHEFYHLLQAELGPRVLVDKSPSYALDLEVLQRAEEDFEEARYIHLLRHPAAALWSFEEAHLEQVFFRYAQPFTPRELGELIWLISQQNILAFLEQVPRHRQTRVRFEELVRDPQPTLERLCAFLGIDFQPAMVLPYQDPAQRMTDGVQAVSRMLGDVRFHEHTTIDPQVADRWQHHLPSDFLSDLSWHTAESLGYQRLMPTDRATLIPRQSDQDQAMLSFAQQRLWFLDQLSPGNSFYNIPSAVRLIGKLDVAALTKSFNQVIERHAALRTTFTLIKGQPIQIIASSLTLPLPVVDLRRCAASDREIQVRRLALDEAQRSFDLVQGPLVRAILLWLDAEEHVLLLTMHHIVSDGWSMGIMIREMAVTYRAASRSKSEAMPDLDHRLPDLPIQYVDFAVWQRHWLQGEVLEAQLSYWRQQLAGAPALIDLADRPRPPMQTFRGSTLTFTISKSLANDLKTLSQREGVTLFMTLLAAFDTLLYRYTGQSDIVVGSPTANRNRAQIEGLIGFFVNTLVLRTDLSGNPSFRDLLDRVRQLTTDAYTHQDLPFEMLVEALQPERSLSHSPLFQIMFVFQNAPLEALDLPDLRLSPVEIDSATSRFDLTLSLWETERGLGGACEYNTDLFDAVTISCLAQYFQTLLEDTVLHPDRRVSDLALLTEAEKHRLLVEWNKTTIAQDGSFDAARSTSLVIHELFEGQVEQAPDVVAVVYADDQAALSLTYGELNRRSNQLAHYLQTLGVGPEVLVGICLDHSVEMLIGVLGILKAGGAYLPLNPNYPSARLDFMLVDAQVKVVLTQTALRERFSQSQLQVVCLDTPWQTFARESDGHHLREATSIPLHRRDSAATEDNLAYVIYTSGSTGAPKGVMVSQRALTSHAMALSETMQQEPPARMLQFISLSFDASAEEIFPALISGVTLILPGAVEELVDEQLAQFCERQCVTVLHLPVSFWHQWVDVLAANDQRMPASLKMLLVGGESPSLDKLHSWIHSINQPIEFVNAYGPTEATITTTLYEMTCEAAALTGLYRIPIGRPISRRQVYVLNDQLQPVPIGAPGELYIGGQGLARGYLGHPELTANNFIPNPFLLEADEQNGGTRLYKTGDRARYRPDGTLEFLGRQDHQVKLRGFRIELEEIEAVLKQHSAVQEVAVVIREVPLKSNDPQSPMWDKRLVAYMTVKEGQSLAANDLRGSLKEKLPEFMVPATYVFLAALPKTASGKIDRRALPAPDRIGSEDPETFVAPHTPVEQALAGIWIEVLGLERVSIHDNFFDLGGHSLLAAQLRSHIRDGLQVELPLREIFETPTIAGLAKSIEVLRWAAQNRSPAAPPATGLYEEIEL